MRLGRCLDRAAKRLCGHRTQDRRPSPNARATIALVAEVRHHRQGPAIHLWRDDQRYYDCGGAAAHQRARASTYEAVATGRISGCRTSFRSGAGLRRQTAWSHVALTLRTWNYRVPSARSGQRFARAMSDAAYRWLPRCFIAFYAESLCTPHWGEIANLLPGNRLELNMNFQGLDKAQVTAIWQPFLDWLAATDDLTSTPPMVIAGPGRHRRDGAALEAFAPGNVLHDDRPGAPAANFFWSANLAEAGHVIHGFVFRSAACKPAASRATGGARLMRPRLRAAIGRSSCTSRRDLPAGRPRRSRRPKTHQ